MLKFPENLYCDVRIEDSFETLIQYRKEVLFDHRVRQTHGAFVRVFDGSRWYTAATTETSTASLQKTLDELSELATPCADVLNHPTVQSLRPHRAKEFRFAERSVRNVLERTKAELLRCHFPVFQEFTSVGDWQARYRDTHVVKRFLSSKGADVEFDSQLAGLVFASSFSESEKQFFDYESIVENSFEDLRPNQDKLRKFLSSCETYMKHAEPLSPGNYTVLLSPIATGIFAHESFGHKSEADFMLGDSGMLEEWKLGKQVASPVLSIVDSGRDGGIGDLPFDDEGNATERTYLIKGGVLAGRLHSAQTSGCLSESPTGNARALNFEYDVMPRMRSTYIEPGERPLAELLAGVADGVFIESVKHGSGMSTFTIAPARAWRIRNGIVSEPVRVAVLSGNVMTTLGEIDAVSSDFSLISPMRGGCGKHDQRDLPVAFGGPYVLVRNMRIS